MAGAAGMIVGAVVMKQNSAVDQAFRGLDSGEEDNVATSPTSNVDHRESKNSKYSKTNFGFLDAQEGYADAGQTTGGTGSTDPGQQKEESLRNNPFEIPGNVRWFEQRKTVSRWLMSPHFDAAIGFVIMLNALTVGLDQQFRLENKLESDPYVVAVYAFEQCFLVIYIVELALRVFAMGPKCFKDNWVLFDLVLVVLGVLNSWILEPFVLGDGDGLGPLMVLRMGRLLRLAKTVRLLVKFKVLWMLVRGLLTSAGTMVYTLLLLFVILYIFSCIGFELITCNPLVAQDDEFSELVADWFGDMPSIMLTLLQFVCLDSVGSIYRPMIKRCWYLNFYFVGIIMVLPIVLMNLVTAVIVNGALEQAGADKEAMAIHEKQKRKKVVRDLHKMFKRIDKDESGMVSRQEIMDMGFKDKQMLRNVANVENPSDIFNCLDVDGSGEIDIDEFCDGIWAVGISKVPMEMKRMELQVGEVHRRIIEISQQQAKTDFKQATFMQTVDNALRRLEQLLGAQPGSQLPSTRSGSADRNKSTGRSFSENQEGIRADPTSIQEPTADRLPEDTPACARLIISEISGLRQGGGWGTCRSVPAAASSSRSSRKAAPHPEQASSGGNNDAAGASAQAKVMPPRSERDSSDSCFISESTDNAAQPAFPEVKVVRLPVARGDVGHEATAHYNNAARATLASDPDRIPDESRAKDVPLTHDTCEGGGGDAAPPPPQSVERGHLGGHAAPVENSGLGSPRGPLTLGVRGLVGAFGGGSQRRGYGRPPLGFASDGGGSDAQRWRGGLE